MRPVYVIVNFAWRGGHGALKASSSKPFSIVVTEQVPAAIWGESGLLNTRGELFVAEARHVPAELPRLSGPEGSSNDVARRYLAVREQLIPVGLDLRSVHLDARGSWLMTLGNGILRQCFWYKSRATAL